MLHRLGQSYCPIKYHQDPNKKTLFHAQHETPKQEEKTAQPYIPGGIPEDIQAFRKTRDYQMMVEKVTTDVTKIKSYITRSKESDTFKADMIEKLQTHLNRFTGEDNKLQYRKLLTFTMTQEYLPGIVQFLDKENIPDHVKHDALLTLCDNLDKCENGIAGNLSMAWNQLRLASDGKGAFLAKEKEKLFSKYDFIIMAEIIKQTNIDTQKPKLNMVEILPHFQAYFRNIAALKLGMKPTADPASKKDSEDFECYSEILNEHFPGLIGSTIEELGERIRVVITPVAICNQLLEEYGALEIVLNEIKTKLFKLEPVLCNNGNYVAFQEEVGNRVLKPLSEFLGRPVEIQEISAWEESEDEAAGNGFFDFSHFRDKLRALISVHVKAEFGIKYATPEGNISIKLGDGCVITRPFDGEEFIVYDPNTLGGPTPRPLKPEDLERTNVTCFKTEILEAMIKYFEKQGHIHPGFSEKIWIIPEKELQISCLLARKDQTANTWYSQILPILKGTKEKDALDENGFIGRPLAHYFEDFGELQLQILDLIVDKQQICRNSPDRHLREEQKILDRLRLRVEEGLLKALGRHEIDETNSQATYKKLHSLASAITTDEGKNPTSSQNRPLLKNLQLCLGKINIPARQLVEELRTWPSEMQTTVLQRVAELANREAETDPDVIEGILGQLPDDKQRDLFNRLLKTTKEKEGIEFEDMKLKAEARTGEAAQRTQALADRLRELLADNPDNTPTETAPEGRNRRRLDPSL